MTKKPSVKNKAWEKDRRDRLNKAFDELAKLLPKYDPSVVWSKNEIIQKAIEFVVALQKKQEDYLKTTDPKLFREYEEFVNCLKFYQKRNAHLTELLKNAKIALPPVVLPQMLVDKPELLPKESEVMAVSVEKPKRGRKKTKKTDDEAKKTEEHPAIKKAVVNISGDKTAQIAEQAVKPTAIITAFTREKVSKSPVKHETPTPEYPPTARAKPIVLCLKKPSLSRKSRLIAQPTFRKCYPHPNKMIQWSCDSLTRRKLPLKPKKITKKKCLRKAKPQSQLVKLEIPSEPMREQSVSPTAAYLLSFPVVTSSILSGKNVENVENNENSVSLENLNNFFTTEEYNKFCDEKVLTPICSPLPVESIAKPLISGKPMTVFTVSAITRPSSPKKPIVGKQTFSMTDNKTNRIAPQNCYNLTNNNPMIGSTSMCNSSLTFAGQQSASLQYSSINAPVSSVKLEPKANAENTKGTPFPRYFISSSMKNASESTPKVPMPLETQKQNQAGQTVNKNTCNSSPKLPSLNVNKPPASTFCSPTKNFFYDLHSTQSQSISAFNFNLPPITSLSSRADPLISSTAAIKSHPYRGFPSIKTEFSWLTPNTTAPLTPTTKTTATTNFAPFDLAAAIVCETLTPTSFTVSVTTPKSSESNVSDVGNKQNLFLPYEDTQYTPAFTVSLTKPTESQVYPSAPWKLEKSKEIPEQIFYDCEQSKPQQKSHVNWMTSPTTEFTSSATALPLPPVDFGNQFTSDFPFNCRKDSYDDDNQFINWSPTKPLTTDFSTTTYNFENFGSNEPPPNKTIKQIFSVSQLVDQTPEKPIYPKKKNTAQKSVPVKQTFSNIYSAESLIAKKDNIRLSNVANFYNTEPQTDNGGGYHHSSSNYFYNYPNTQNCAQAENDYLGAYSTQSTVKSTSSLPSTTGQGSAPFDPTSSSTTAPNYFAHSISSSANDPYDPTYFPSSNYNHPSTSNWNHATTKVAPVNGYNSSQLLPSMTFGSVESNSNVSGNVTNFNLSSICPEIDDKEGSSEW